MTLKTRVLTAENSALPSHTHFHGRHNYIIIFSYYFIGIFYIRFFFSFIEHFNI